MTTAHTFQKKMLLAAIGRDANDQMYPVAWAVVEGENNSSWQWCMYQLKVALEVTEDGKGWILISDQQKGLLNEVAMYWEKAEHRNCARHIYANWNKKHKGEDLRLTFWKAVRAYNEADFLDAIEEMKTLDEDATTAFLALPTKAFCRCYFKGGSNADIVVSNMAETNGYIIKSRSMHIINMLEDIREKIMTRLKNKHDEMVNKAVSVCPRIQDKLDKQKAKAHHCTIFPSTSTLFQVKDRDDVCVDLENRTCTCRMWDLSGIPCHHVCALVGWLGKPAEDFVAKCYTKTVYMKSYDICIPPLPSAKFWPRVEFPLDPPPIKSAPGRPKKNRRKDPHENPKKPGTLSRHGASGKCSICNTMGHNRKTCTEIGKAAKTSAPASQQPSQTSQQAPKPGTVAKLPIKRARKSTVAKS